MDDASSLHRFARAFVVSQLRAAVDRQVESWKSANSESPCGIDADFRAEAETPAACDASKDAYIMQSELMERIQTLVAEVLTTALQNTTAVLSNRKADLHHKQHHHKASGHRHHHHQQQLTRESIELVYSSILNQALARVISHLCEAPPPRTESTQELALTEQPPEHCQATLEQPVELSTENSAELPNEKPGQPQAELSSDVLVGPDQSHRHHHHRKHKKRVLQVAEHFCNDLLAEAVHRLADRSSNVLPAVLVQATTEATELSPTSNDQDFGQTQSEALSEIDTPSASIEVTIASTDEAPMLADVPTEISSNCDVSAPQLETSSVLDPAPAAPLRTSSSTRRKRAKRRLCSRVAETFVTELLSEAVTWPLFIKKSPEPATSIIIEATRPTPAPERPAKGRADGLERKAKSREKEPLPEVLTTAKSFSDSTSFVLPPLVLPQARERTPPQLEPLVVQTKEPKRKPRSKDHQTHQKSIPKSSNDLTLELKIEREAEITSNESPAAITARAAAFIYQPRSAASLPSQHHPRRQDPLDPVKKGSHSRDSPRAAMLANAKVASSTSALLHPIAVPSPVFLPPSPTKERSKERLSPVKASSPTKKRSGFCHMCVLEGRSCKINDCLKHQLLK